MAVCYALQGCVVASAVDLAATAVVQTGKIAVKGTSAAVRAVIPDGNDDDKKAKKEQMYISYDITFASDFPLQGYTYTAPNATLPTSGFTIDGIDISKYGIYLLEENQNTLLKDYEIKEHLSINSTAISGVQYAEHSNVFKERTLELHCYISQPINIFWQLYEALLYNLTKQGERTINIPTSFRGVGGGLNAIYQKASVKNVFLIQNTLKVEFTITFVLT